MDKIITLVYPAIVINVGKSPAGGLGTPGISCRGLSPLRTCSGEQPFLPSAASDAPRNLLPGLGGLPGNTGQYFHPLAPLDALWVQFKQQPWRGPSLVPPATVGLPQGQHELKWEGPEKGRTLLDCASLDKPLDRCFLNCHLRVLD